MCPTCVIPAAGGILMLNEGCVRQLSSKAAFNASVLIWWRKPIMLNYTEYFCPRFSSNVPASLAGQQRALCYLLLCIQSRIF